MKLYRHTMHDADEGTLFSWHASKADAMRAKREFEARRGESCDAGQVEAVDVPTDKRGLLSWLNSNCNSDNG